MARTLARRSRSKYRNLKVILPDGTKFDSTHEYRVWQQLAAAEKAGAIRDLHRQVPFKICWPDGRLICTYYADFTYTIVENGLHVVSDAKGIKTSTYSLKKKLMKLALRIDIHEVYAK